MAHKESRSWLEVKMDALRRQYAWHFLSARAPYYLVSEYPKSGGSWVAQILAEYLEVPFPRNQNISILHPAPALLHGHHLYNPRFRHAVYVLRDGRDVVTSAYYYFLQPNEMSAPWEMQYKEQLRKQLGIINVDDIETGMPIFIEYMFTKHARRWGRFTWDSFTLAALNNDATCVRYEDMLQDTPGSMAPVIKALSGREADAQSLCAICEKYAFKNQTRREAGEEDTSNFLRKGVAGDWRNKFTHTACEIFDHYAGDALIVSGYEPDHQWIEQV